MNKESIQIQHLRHRYQNSFVQKSNDIKGFIQRLSEDSTPFGQPLNELYAFLHKLAGSSGMYDFKDIETLTRDAMWEIEQQTAPDFIARLTQQLSHLRKLLGQHS